MDLEEFRRAYMRAESMGNTPGNFLKRTSNLAQSIGGVFSAANKDNKERQRRKGERQKAYEEFKQKGKGNKIKSVGKIVKNSPFILDSQSSKAAENLKGSVINAAKSINELGSTAASITGTNLNNSTYDDQDLEKGIHFALMASSYINKGVKLPKNVAIKASSLAKDTATITGSISVSRDKNGKTQQRSHQRSRQRTQTHSRAAKAKLMGAKAVRGAARGVGSVIDKFTNKGDFSR